ncbi:SDR family NAD(P)-dependent oxidoreductase [Parahaliea mediterranea]|uniref:SDR family oxidoreductase n=1 Tax=Parahaliea mediterranea TaxID=651086 RepID=A0A939DI73_9GAMM|nr:SDR family oxidoreductase [Parahaliea mediterranea]MBN7798621.1 SDR family oxidoreductase [Parahaliea mediterranea]
MTGTTPTPVAFITGASRGIGAASAVALAQAGFDLAITARTLEQGERHEHGSFASNTRTLPGSLAETAAQVRALGRQCLCLRSDILHPQTVIDAIRQTERQLGRIDLLFNNACYQGPGNMQGLLEVTAQQAQAIYQGNVLTPLAAVQAALPGMLERGSGTVINMVSASAVNDPPAPPGDGGWSFAYPSSKAALMRMVPSLRVEHPGPGMRYFNVEPGFVYTEVMRANNFGEAAAARFKPSTAQEIAEVIRWLACAEGAAAFADKNLVYAPQLLKQLQQENRK